MPDKGKVTWTSLVDVHALKMANKLPTKVNVIVCVGAVGEAVSVAGVQPGDMQLRRTSVAGDQPGDMQLAHPGSGIEISLRGRHVQTDGSHR